MGLSAGTHTIKLAIADAGDTVLDSAVFIQAGSFSDTTSIDPVPELGTWMLMGTGLWGGSARAGGNGNGKPYRHLSIACLCKEAAVATEMG